MKNAIRTNVIATCIAALAILAAGCGESGVNSGGESKYLNMFLDVFSKNPGHNHDTTGTPTTPATYTLSVNVSPVEGGTVSRDIEQSSYEAGTQVTVTATPKPDYEFSGWSGASNAKEPAVTVTMDGDKALSAVFQKIGANVPTYTVYFNANVARGDAPEAMQWCSGTQISLPGQAGMVKEWHSFAGWNTEADGSGEHYDAYAEYTVTRTATLFAKWTRDTYTLTVNAAAGGTTSRNPNRTTYDAGTEITVMANPNEHYTFTGWSGASSSTNPTVTIFMDANKELTPNFTQNKYTLTTNKSIDNGGSVSRSPNSESYNPGTEVTVTATPAAGYRFTGWSGASSSTNTTVTIRMDEDKSLTAGFGKIGAKTFTVTFNRNGATVGNLPAEVTADSNATITLPGQGSMERTGYGFGGWTENISGTGTLYSVGSSYTVKNDVTLYAKWIPIYTITFSGNNATSGSAPAAIKADSGKNVTMPPQGTLSKTGHTFDGWNTKNDGSGTSYGAGQSSYTATNNDTLYAKWNPLPYTVTFNGNGATGDVPAPINSAYGSTITLSTMTRAGYTFDGWYENSAGTGNAVNSPYTVTKDITLYAKWTPTIYQITYNLSGGTATPANPTSYTIETPTFTLNNPTKTEDTFTGWTGTEISAPPQLTVTIATGSVGERNYTANWTPKGYSLTANANPPNNGTVSPSPNKTTYNHGENVLVTATPINGCHTFTGWSGDASGTANPLTVTMDKNKTITANFQQNQYTMTTNVSPAGGGSVSPNSNNLCGEQVTVTATAANGYRFKNWTTTSNGVIFANANSATTTFTMPTNAVTVTANFEAVYTLTTNAAPAGSGTVSRSPNNDTYAYGEQVTLTTTATSGYKLKKWTNSGVTLTDTTSQTISFNMPANAVTVTANFQTVVTDSRDNKIYWTTKIGDRTWMAENLKYNTSSGSWCYNNSDNNCNTYGRLYDWNTARTACPSGWHLPFRQEWETLANAVGGAATAGTRLKTTTGWNNNSNGTDIYGFSAMPSGWRESDGSAYYGIGGAEHWWTASFYSGQSVYIRKIDDKPSLRDENRVATYGFSVRCIQNDGTPTFTDSRNGDTYRVVKIGNQTWMGENLNYKTGNSWCYSDNTGNNNGHCDAYGRLYDWNTAKTACPSGWHLPSRLEWDNLAAAVGGTKAYTSESDTHHWYDAGKKLKSAGGWNSNGNGTDDFGFSALPGGFYYNSSFVRGGDFGCWWTATEGVGSGAYIRYMYYDFVNVNEDYYSKSNGFSVRCIKD